MLMIIIIEAPKGVGGLVGWSIACTQASGSVRLQNNDNNNNIIK
jgi:hypothetical protein